MLGPVCHTTMSSSHSLELIMLIAHYEYYENIQTMKHISLSRLQLEKILTEKEAQVELQTSEITATEERMRHLQTQLQQTEV